MRIRLHCIINSLAPQGAQNMLLRLLGRIDRERFEPVVTTLIDQVPMARQFAEIEVPVRVLGVRSHLDGPLALLRLVRQLRADPPHIIQTWLYHADLFGGIAARLAGRAPVVWNIRHSNLEPQVNRRTTLLTAKACAHLSGWLPAKIICCAEAARQSHVQFGYAERRFEVIPNGFDLGKLSRQTQARREIRDELGIAEQTLVIGLVGRFHPQKDHRNFIQAAARFATRYPGLRFLLAGDEVQWDNRILVEWIQQAGLADKVSLLGRRDDIPRLLSAVDIATSSSLGEGFPNAVGEAMACQVPCVVTDVGDSALLVGDTGVVVPARNPQALAAAWEHLALMGEGQRRLLGERGRQRIREQFSLEAVVASYEKLYFDLFAATMGGKKKAGAAAATY
ncbi:MAG: hypothetical protein A2091_12715 [Desulfuromonadales bacterium GWD2_61_12]|nr:MAG: hypothetical protein A2005_11440 [Desulfuromonadales bacterium GWC2_61_20]OGR36545.1 MAG: hypothetical protein A2091_12715 [Desulfuromonadales bacterium GWD2_61_12]HAD05062.1 phosphatidylinositol alpha-mannosyltransferase [Desulfuromonas sp.]HBT83963.1 phosphatidylinositol alpha-mannosyltransferase [Desulfuromonas sp.]